MHADHSARGRLHSGATVRSALRIAEDVASDYVKTIVATVADISQDSEAFGMILTDVTILLRDLQVGVDQAAKFATGRGEGTNDFPSVSRETNRLFLELQQRTLRLLEIHRFSFTRPSPARRVELRSPALSQPEAQLTKNKGGKPLAAHWDGMWAEIAVQLWTGDLKPQSQADIKRVMLSWFDENGIEIGDTAVTERARQLWRKMEIAQ